MKSLLKTIFIGQALPLLLMSSCAGETNKAATQNYYEGNPSRFQDSLVQENIQTIPREQLVITNDTCISSCVYTSITFEEASPPHIDKNLCNEIFRQVSQLRCDTYFSSGDSVAISRNMVERLNAIRYDIDSTASRNVMLFGASEYFIHVKCTDCYDGVSVVILSFSDSSDLNFGVEYFEKYDSFLESSPVALPFTKTFIYKNHIARIVASSKSSFDVVSALMPE